MATSIFLPYEVYDLAVKPTWLRAAAFVINLLLVIYLAWTKRLFGVRGGKRACQARLRTESVIEVEQAALAAASPGQPGQGKPASAAVQPAGDAPSSAPAPSGASSPRPTPPHSSDSTQPNRVSDRTWPSYAPGAMLVRGMFPVDPPPVPQGSFNAAAALAVIEHAAPCDRVPAASLQRSGHAVPDARPVQRLAVSRDLESCRNLRSAEWYRGNG